MKCPNCEAEIGYVKIIHTSTSYASVDSCGLINGIRDDDRIMLSCGIIVFAICPECDYDITKDIEDGEGFFNTQ